MNHLKEMLKRADFTNIVSYLIYGAATSEKTIDNYESKLKESFNKFFSEIEKLYPQANREDDNLFNIVLDFTVIRDNIHFEVGVLVGSHLYQSLEQGRKSIEKNNLQSFVKKCVDNHIKLKKIMEKDSLLEKIIDYRTGEDLEELFRQDKKFQKVNKKTKKKIEKIGELGLDPIQWQTVDMALTACGERSAEYIRIAYLQGFRDAAILFMEIMN